VNIQDENGTAWASQLQHENLTISYPKCTTNPYESAINESFGTVFETAQDWLDHVSAYESIATQTIYSKPGHSRFFPFETMASCKDLQCIGGECSGDESKYACGISYLSQFSANDCVIYSIGGNGLWGFEKDLLNRTKCQIHTFDCTGPIGRFRRKPRNSRLHFHHICLGAKFAHGTEDCKPKRTPKRTLCGETWTLDHIQRHLGHDRIDLLKMDIEGWEWPIFDVDSTNATIPMQVLIEVHYGLGTRRVIHDKTMKSASDLVRLQSNFLKMGLVTVHRDDNPFCPHCSELTLLRVAC